MIYLNLEENKQEIDETSLLLEIMDVNQEIADLNFNFLKLNAISIIRNEDPEILNEGFKEFISKLWEKIKLWFDKFITWIKTTVTKFKLGYNAGRIQIEQFKAVFKNLKDDKDINVHKFNDDLPLLGKKIEAMFYFTLKVEEIKNEDKASKFKEKIDSEIEFIFKKIEAGKELEAGAESDWNKTIGVYNTLDALFNIDTKVNGLKNRLLQKIKTSKDDADIKEATIQFNVINSTFHKTFNAYIRFFNIVAKEARFIISQIK